jgi:hypothetical protein
MLLSRPAKYEMRQDNLHSQLALRTHHSALEVVIHRERVRLGRDRKEVNVAHVRQSFGDADKRVQVSQHLHGWDVNWPVHFDVDVDFIAVGVDAGKCKGRRGLIFFFPFIHQPRPLADETRQTYGELGKSGVGRDVMSHG